jgi:uncharacterized RDD family membrane protein YckC
LNSPPELNQHHTIWTPELVELSMPLAGIARRCLARLCDQLILFIFYVAYIAWVIFNFKHFYHSPTQLAALQIASLIIFTVTDFAYFWAFHNFMNGQTPGKKWMKIRVVSQRGGKINATTALIRGLFNIVDMGLFSGGISALMILMTKQEKRIADFAAGTIVVQDS